MEIRSVLSLAFFDCPEETTLSPVVVAGGGGETGFPVETGAVAVDWGLAPDSTPAVDFSSVGGFSDISTTIGFREVEKNRKERDEFAVQ
jgi:hypothetical protein